MYFNMNSFNVTVHRLTVVKSLCVLTSADVQHAAYVFVILWLPDDGYSMWPKHVGA
jgi:hypothetical protein